MVIFNLWKILESSDIIYYKIKMTQIFCKLQKYYANINDVAEWCEYLIWIHFQKKNLSEILTRRDLSMKIFSILMISGVFASKCDSPCPMIIGKDDLS